MKAGRCAERTRLSEIEERRANEWHEDVGAVEGRATRKSVNPSRLRASEGHGSPDGFNEDGRVPR
jgi:hypothetical protein